MSLNVKALSAEEASQEPAGRIGVDRPLTKAEEYIKVAFNLATKEVPDYDSAIINYNRALNELKVNPSPCNLGIASAGLNAARAAKHEGADFMSLFEESMKELPGDCFV